MFSITFRKASHTYEISKTAAYLTTRSIVLIKDIVGELVLQSEGLAWEDVWLGIYGNKV